MLSNGNKKDCGFANEIVSYIYDEASAPERSEFETHLAGCTSCTDEFAGISDARFSVFEWHREEFADMPTPAIVIPYPAKASVEEKAGFLAGLRGLFAFPVVPVAAAAVVVIAAGFGFVTSNVFEPETIAHVIPGPQPAMTSPAIADSSNPVENGTAQSNRILPVTERAEIREAAPTPRQSRRTRQSTEEIRPTRALAMRKIKQAKPPALTAFEEPVDKSLRLSDLFDDGGAGR